MGVDFLEPIVTFQPDYAGVLRHATALHVYLAACRPAYFNVSRTGAPVRFPHCAKTYRAPGYGGEPVR